MPRLSLYETTIERCDVNVSYWLCLFTRLCICQVCQSRRRTDCNQRFTRQPNHAGQRLFTYLLTYLHKPICLVLLCRTKCMCKADVRRSIKLANYRDVTTDTRHGSTISSADCLRKPNHAQKVGHLFRSSDVGLRCAFWAFLTRLDKKMRNCFILRRKFWDVFGTFLSENFLAFCWHIFRGCKNK